MREYTLEPGKDHSGAWGHIQGAVSKGLESGKVLITIQRPRRNNLTNRKLHAMLSDIRSQVVITLEGADIPLRCYAPDVVKTFLVRWFDLELKELGEPLRVSGRKVLDPATGEVIYCRPSTTEFSQGEAGKFVLWLYAFGDARGVKWSEPAIKCYDEYLQKPDER